MSMARSRGAALLAGLCLGCATARPNTGSEMDIGDVPPGVSVSARLQYYDVNAATLADIRQAIRRSGPQNDGRTWGAVTTWNFVWTYQAERMGATGCEVRQAQVKVTLLTTFPRWNATAEPDSSLVDWWRQYSAGLVEHERGHVVLAVQGGGAIVQALRGLLVFCDKLRDQTNAIANRLLVDIRADQLAYDRETRHGGTQIQQAQRLREP